MIRKQVPRQRDFSGGEADPEAARRDDAAIVRAAARQMSNKRVLPTGSMAQRPGRRALYASSGYRNEDIRISSTELYRISFGAGTLDIFNDAGTSLYSATGLPWSNSTINEIVWDRFLNLVIVCFPDMRPIVLTLTGGAWAKTNFTFDVALSGQKKTPFYRFSDGGITLQPSGVTGTVNIVFSGDVLTSSSVGTSLRYQGRQMTIASVTNATHGTATVNERLFPTQILTVSADPAVSFSLGEAVEGGTSGATGYIGSLNTTAYTATGVTVNSSGAGGYTAGDTLTVLGGTGTAATITVDTVDGSGNITGVSIAGAGYYTALPSFPASVTGGTGSGATVTLTTSSTTNTVEVVLSSARKFVSSEDISGPYGTATVSAANDADPGATIVWDEEVMNDLRGWPRSVFVDQNRLGFTDFPSLTRGVAWSATDAPADFLVGANPEDAMLELLKGVGRIYHVVPGDDEFVFSDAGVFYIPISETNPLKPGSVTFRPVTTLAANSVRPVTTPEGLAFVDAGGNRVIGIRPTGQITKPYLARSISDLHSHLITGPVCFASGADDPAMPERYVYLLNNDGTVAVARYDDNKNWVGWMPWTAGGGGAFKWVSCARGSNALFTTYYAAVSQALAEILDPDAWLDAQVLVNAAPAALAPPSGKGPLWFLAGGTVYLMDGLFPMDTREVDADGNIVAIEGEDLSSADLIAGFAWEEVFEPFVPHTAEGASQKQTLRRRKISRIGVQAEHRAGYVCAGRRVPTWRLGVDDMSANPPLRNEVQFFRSPGRAVDPTFEVVKDVPGEMTIAEVSMEVTI